MLSPVSVIDHHRPPLPLPGGITAQRPVDDEQPAAQGEGPAAEAPQWRHRLGDVAFVRIGKASLEVDRSGGRQQGRRPRAPSLVSDPRPGSSVAGLSARGCPTSVEPKSWANMHLHYAGCRATPAISAV